MVYFAAQFDAAGTMNDAIQNAVGRSGVADLAMAVGDRPLRSQHQRATF
jgi:hypothetical protein